MKIESQNLWLLGAAIAFAVVAMASAFIDLPAFLKALGLVGGGFMATCCVLAWAVRTA